MSNTEDTQAIAASKAGMDVKTARKYLRARRLPSAMKAERHWLMRPDGFAEVWPEIVEAGSDEPEPGGEGEIRGLQGKYPGQFSDGQLRTLQRGVRRWRATEGPGERSVLHSGSRAGELCESDFTHMTSWSDGRRGAVCPYGVPLCADVLELGGGQMCASESFASLSEGLQKALWELGGIPLLHRTDR